MPREADRSRRLRQTAAPARGRVPACDVWVERPRERPRAAVAPRRPLVQQRGEGRYTGGGAHRGVRRVPRAARVAPQQAVAQVHVNGEGEVARRREETPAAACACILAHVACLRPGGLRPGGLRPGERVHLCPRGVRELELLAHTARRPVALHSRAVVAAAARLAPHRRQPLLRVGARREGHGEPSPTDFELVRR
eukprot:scaffold111898_cov75-Phaeocystis_antarctica.AAC.3